MKGKVQDNFLVSSAAKLLATIFISEIFVMIFLNLNGDNGVVTVEPLIIFGDAFVVSVIASVAIFFWIVNPVKLFKERVEIGQRLVKQSEYIDKFFKNTITPLAILDRYFNFIRVNEAYAKADNRKVSDFPGHNHFEFYPSDAKKTFEDVVKVKKTYFAFAHPFEYHDHPERGITYWNWSLTPSLNSEEEVEYLIFSLENVTEKVKAEELLKAMAVQEGAIAELGQFALTNHDINLVLEKTVDLVVKTLDVEFCKILELLPDKKEFILKAGSGWNDGYVGICKVSADLNSQAGFTLTTNEPVVVYDLSAETRFKGPKLLTDHKIRSGLSVIISGNDDPYGILGAHTKKLRCFTNNDVDFFKSISNVLADALRRKFYEQELMKLKMGIEASEEAIFLTDQEGIITFVNQKFCNLYGFTAEEVVGKVTPRIIKSGILPQDVYVDFWQRILNKEVIKGEITNKTKDGRLLTIEGSVNPVLDKNGEIISFLAIQRDITEHKKNEEDLKKMRQAIDTSGEAIFLTDIDGIFTFVNTEFTKLYGFTSAEVVGKVTPRILKSELYEKAFYKAFWKKMLNKELVRDELINKTKNGDLITIERSVSPILDLNTNLIGFLAVQRNITDRKRAEREIVESKEKAEKANKLKTNFLATMSHEIRTPLNAILGHNNLIRELFYETVDKDTQDSINAIQDDSRRLLTTMTDIFDISRIDAGDFEIDKKPISLAYIISSVINDLKTFAKKKKIEVYLKPLKIQVLVIGDEYCLKGSLSKILHNAIKFSDKGIIKIDVSKDEHYGVCSITDEGIGISEKYQKHLFIPFSQEDIGYSRKYEGSGLSLALTKRFIELMDGKIEIKSKSGIGTTVTVKIPLQ